MTVQKSTRKLTPELYHIFRDGMSLRKKHVEDIFGTSILDRAHPNLITKSKQYAYEGTDLLKQEVPDELVYDFEQFKTNSPDIYYLFKTDEDLSASVLNNLPRATDGIEQTTHAFLSGVLKLDTRGYYFDPEALKQLQVQEYLEMINNEE